MGKNTGKCQYLVEEEVAEGWTLPAHKKWLEETDRLLLEFGVRDPEAALQILTQVVNISSQLRRLKRKYPVIAHFLDNIKID